MINLAELNYQEGMYRDNVTVSMQEGTHWQLFKQEEELVKYKRPKQKKSTKGIYYATDGTLMLTSLLQ